MSYYSDFYTNPKTCKNFGDGRKLEHTIQTQEDAREAYANSKSKNLRMVPCSACSICRGYVFAGADSGKTPFCYNYEPKPL